jgi:hypothetical protein
MANGYKIIVVILVAAIIVGFFLPWVNVESKQMGTFTKLLTGKEQKTIHYISGLDIPVLANSDESRLIVSIAKIFNPDIQDVDKKSFFVLAVPILALIILLLALFQAKNLWVSLIIGLVGCAVFFFALYKIKAADLERAVLQIRIGFGLWAILYAYLAIGAVNIINFIKLTVDKGKR